MLPESFCICLQLLAEHFTAPGFARFVTLMQGWLMCTVKRTVTGLMRAAGVVGEREHSGFHRFFSRGTWSPDELGVTLMRLVLTLVPDDERVTLTIDDTLARHTGKHISSAGMHRDPLLSCAKRPFWHFGHNWVVLAVVVDFPRWAKSYSLPVFAHLYRTRKTNEELGLEHRKLPELGSELLAVLARSFPERKFLVIGDNNYVNASVVRPLPSNVELLGRGRLDAAIYEKAPPRKKGTRGRPRVKGARLPSPKSSKKRWKSMTVRVYGREVELRVKVMRAVWYKVSYDREMLFVVVRGWPGHKKDDVLASTDIELDPRELIELYCKRWSLEETFHWVKSKLGFEDPQNRVEHAVQRTAPMALWAYSLVVVWYARWARRRTKLPMERAPWNPSKNKPTFADMLATLRRWSWATWISDLAASDRLDQKSLRPLLEAVAYA